MQGKTVKVKMTKWGKKKDGLFGRVRTTRDEFVCEGQQSASLADRESEISEDCHTHLKCFLFLCIACHYTDKYKRQRDMER